jgi:hypothetical protein
MAHGNSQRRDLKIEPGRTSSPQRPSLSFRYTQGEFDPLQGVILHEWTMD